MQKPFLLTFDLEKFDLPIEFGVDISNRDVFSTSYEGQKVLLKILGEHGIKSTFFTTTLLAKKYPNLVRKIVKDGHEVSLHGYDHTGDFSELHEGDMSNLLKAKKELEKIAKTKVLGFRHPRLKTPSYKLLKEVGIKYDSSVHPTYVPGRYNNLFSKTGCYEINGIIEVPISVTPISKFPFSWIWFRNFGVNYAKVCTSMTSRSSPFINLYFHPWELVNLQGYDIPYLIKRNTGETMGEMLNSYIEWCIEKGFKFCTINEFLGLK